jgi:hypothetical protein
MQCGIAMHIFNKSHSSYFIYLTMKKNHSGGNPMLKKSEKKCYEKPVLEKCGAVAERTLCILGSVPYSGGSDPSDFGIRNQKSDMVFFNGGKQGIHGNGQGSWHH